MVGWLRSRGAKGSLSITTISVSCDRQKGRRRPAGGGARPGPREFSSPTTLQAPGRQDPHGWTGATLPDADAAFGPAGSGEEARGSRDRAP